VAVAAAGVALGPVTAAVLVVASAATPRAIRPLVRRRLHDRRDGQLPDALERLAAAIRAGSAPTTAFVALAHEAPEPLRADLRLVAAEIEHGAGMEASIDAWAARPTGSPAVRLAASALSLGVAAGGEVARSMDRVASTLRERRELQAEVHSLATQARASAGVLGMAPFGFTALVSTVEPEMVRFLLTTPVGLLCFVAGVTLEAAGLLWMARIVAAAS
jgi:tight adherence protein B